MNAPTKEQIERAHQRIQPFVHVTPLLINASLKKRFGCSVSFKLENLQKVGAFKARGAHNAVFSLHEDRICHGVATHSSGNHAQALALAAKNRGIPAYIVMPKNAPNVKVQAVLEYGGQVTMCEPNLEARESTLKSIVANTQATEIHPYDNEQVIAGQATVMREIVEQSTDNIDMVVCPVGGGGLLAGTLLSKEYFSPETEIVAAEPVGANDAQRSMQTGERVLAHVPQTCCDGLLTTLGQRNFDIMSSIGVEVITADDQSILRELRRFWQRTKQLIEPSSAVVLAVLSTLAQQGRLQGKHVVAIISGGNVDVDLSTPESAL